MNPLILGLHKLLPLLPLTAGFCLIYIVQGHKLDSKARTSMLIYLSALTFWALGSFMLRNSQDFLEANFWARSIRASATIMGAAMLHFAFELLGLKQRKLVGISYGISVLIAIAALTTGLVTAPSMGVNAWGYYGKGGPLRVACSLFFASQFLYSSVLLFSHRYSKDSFLYRDIRLVLIGFTIVLVGGIADLLPTFNIPFYPMAMITNTVFVILISYGAFKHQLLGVLARGQPRIVLASITYALIAIGVALTFTEVGSREVFVFLLGFIFLAFNAYHFYDDLSYLAQKYLNIRKQPFLLKRVGDSSILFDNIKVGIVALDRQKQILFLNRKAAVMLGPKVSESKSLSYLENDILRHKLEKYSGHRREIVIDLDSETSAEFIPIEMDRYVGTLICLYPKTVGQSIERITRASHYMRLSLLDIFRTK